MDVEGTATRDVEPFFQPPSYVLSSMQMLRSPRNPISAAWLSSWAEQFPAQQVVIDYFIDLDRTFSWLSGQIGPQSVTSWTNLDVDASCMLPLLHRCLQLSRRSASGLVIKDEVASPGPRDKHFQEALRHAIILFLAPIRRYLGLPALGTYIHIRKLISAHELCLHQHAALKLQGIMFWMLVVGALETRSLRRDARWFFSHIADCCTIMGAKRFENIREAVKFAMNQLIWLEEAMSSAFALMMDNFCIFMEEPDKTERREQMCVIKAPVAMMPKVNLDHAIGV
jgi:hypothetical protein